ncbi:pentapeptide repeat-containing protein [Arthrobacter sp. ISL-65]|nr:pentapeptide repeat-containing protein [Arthrobacter sp. ISL-65]
MCRLFLRYRFLQCLSRQCRFPQCTFPQCTFPQCTFPQCTFLQCTFLQCPFLQGRRRNCPRLSHGESRQRRRFPTPGGTRQILLRRHMPLRSRQLGRGRPLRRQETVRGRQHWWKQSRSRRLPAPDCRSPARASRWPSFT